MLRSLPALLSVLLLSGGCAVKSTVKLVQASQAVERAEERGAAEQAPYDYTLATHYLDKAREEAGDAHHRLAQRLADTAADHADQAVIQMQEGGPRPGAGEGSPPGAADAPSDPDAPSADEDPAEAPPPSEDDEPTRDGEPTRDDEPARDDEPVQGGWTPPAEAPPEDAP